MGGLLRRRAILAEEREEDLWVLATGTNYSQYYTKNSVSLSDNAFTYNTKAKNWDTYVTAQPALYKVSELSGRFRFRGHLVSENQVRLFVSVMANSSASPSSTRTKYCDVAIADGTAAYNGDFSIEATIDMSGWDADHYVAARWGVYSAVAITNAAVLTAPVVEAVLV